MERDLVGVVGQERNVGSVVRVSKKNARERRREGGGSTHVGPRAVACLRYAGLLVFDASGGERERPFGPQPPADRGGATFRK